MTRYMPPSRSMLIALSIFVLLGIIILTIGPGNVAADPLSIAGLLPLLASAIVNWGKTYTKIKPWLDRSAFTKSFPPAVAQYIVPSILAVLIFILILVLMDSSMTRITVATAIAGFFTLLGHFSTYVDAQATLTSMLDEGESTQSNVRAWIVNSTPVERDAARNVILETIQGGWIIERLNRRIPPDEAGIITLSFKEWDKYSEQWKEVAYGTTVIQLYRQEYPNAQVHSQSTTCILLGNPGAGKTSTLLQLTKCFLDEARAYYATGNEPDAAHPIPLVFQLQNWDGQSASLVDWMMKQLGLRTYGNLSKYLPYLRYLATENCIRPILDGLNEVPPEHLHSCIRAILAYKSGSAGMLISCRAEDFKTIADEFSFYRHIRISPLGQAEIEGFLQKFTLSSPAGDIASEALAGKTTATETIRDRLLNDEKFQSPLVLRLLKGTLVDRDSPPLSPNMETKDLWPIWFASIFKLNQDKAKADNRNAKLSYDVEAVKGYLSWIARRLTKSQQQHDLFPIESLQPIMLESPHWITAYIFLSRLLCAMVLALCIGRFFGGWEEQFHLGLGAGIAVGLVDMVRLRWHNRRLPSPTPNPWAYILNFAGVYLIVAAVLMPLFGWTERSETPISDRSVFGLANSGIIFGALTALFYAFIFGARGVRQSLNYDIILKERTKFRFDLALLRGPIVGLVAGTIIGIVADLLYLYLPTTTIGHWLTSHTSASHNPVLSTAIYGFGFGFVVGTLIGVMLWGVQADPDTNYESKETHGVTQNLRRALWEGLRWGPASILVLAVFQGIWLGYMDSALRGVYSGLGIGIMAFLVYGGFEVIQHYSLRIMLYLRGDLPYRLPHLLDFSYQLMILNRVGTAYELWHPTLAEYLHGYIGKRDEGVKNRPFVFGLAFVIGIGLIYLALVGIDRMHWRNAQDLIYINDYYNYYYSSLDDSALGCFLAGDTVVVNATGLMKVGNYVGHIRPEGTYTGLLGYGLDDNYNCNNTDTSTTNDCEPKTIFGTTIDWHTYPHGALMCRISGADWEPCFPYSNNPQRLFPRFIRERTYRLQTPSCIELAINDAEPQNNKGGYEVRIFQVQPTTIPTTPTVTP